MAVTRRLQAVSEPREAISHRHHAKLGLEEAKLRLVVWEGDMRTPEGGHMAVTRQPPGGCTCSSGVGDAHLSPSRS